MKTLKVSIKLLWLHIIILLLLVVGIIASLVRFTNIGKQVEALHNGSFVVKSAANTVNETFEAMQMSVFRAISNDSQSITNEAITDARSAAGTIQEQVVLIKQNTLGDTAIISRLEKYLSDLTPMQEYVLNLAVQNKNAEAAAYMEKNNIPIIKEAQVELAELIQSADAKEIQLVTSLWQAQRNTIILLVFLSAIGVLFSIGIGIYIWQLQKKGRQTMSKSKSVQMI